MEKQNMQERLSKLKNDNRMLAMKVQQARASDHFLEREAKERLDLLKKDEIVFIFGDEN